MDWAFQEWASEEMERPRQVRKAIDNRNISATSFHEQDYGAQPKGILDDHTPNHESRQNTLTTSKAGLITQDSEMVVA